MAGKREEMINLLEFSNREKHIFISSLTADQRSAEGKIDAWSVKDRLAHVVYWDADLVAQISGQKRDRPDDVEDFNEANAFIWKEYRATSWQEIEQLIDRTHDRFLVLLEELTEEQLTDPECYDWTNGRPLWRSITAGCFYHALQHLAELYAQRDDTAYANQLQENAADLQMKLDDSDQWQGTVSYNLGCHYAITGQRELALANIRQGIELYPYLKEWAPQDSDVKLLHDDPEFLALVGTKV